MCPATQVFTGSQKGAKNVRGISKKKKKSYTLHFRVSEQRTRRLLASLGGEKLGGRDSCTTETQQGSSFRDPGIIPALTKAVRS